jgi:hypothetical protein
MYKKGLSTGKITEHQIQKAYYDWIKIKRQIDRRYKLIFAVPNGAHFANIRIAVKLLSEGLTPGVSDFIGLCPYNGFHGFVIEFKSEKGVLNKNQREFLQLAFDFGLAPYVARTTDEAIKFTEAYFNGRLSCNPPIVS